MSTIIHSKKKTVTRYPGNPIITGEMMPFNCRGVYNSSAVKYGDGYVMVLRAEGYNLNDSFWTAYSQDGYTWRIVNSSRCLMTILNIDSLETISMTRALP